MCNISRITSANRTPEKTECSVAVNYSPNMLKTKWSCWGRRRACRSFLEWKTSSRSFWKRNSPSTGIWFLEYSALSFRWLLSCIRRVDLLFTSGSDAGFENLWLRRLKVTKVTKLIFSISEQCNQMLAIYYRLNDIKGRGEQIFSSDSWFNKAFQQKKADITVVDQRRRSN